MSSWIAAATSYSVSDTPMIPFYIYYSMFGFQRIGDLAWAAGDSRARGFLVGGTAGRTTLNGEGLQHEDGHSHLLSATIPNCVSYGPTFAHEVAVIVQDGLRRMYAEQEDVFYYLTVMNENYQHPGMPEGREDEVREGIIRGMYLLREGPAAKKDAPRVQLLGCRNHPARGDRGRRAAGTALRRDRRRVERAQLHRAAPRRHRRGPLEYAASGREAAAPSPSSAWPGAAGPVVAATDYMRAFADQIRPYIDRRFRVLGTDGFGVRTTGAIAARHFEVNRHYIALAALTELAAEGAVPASTAADAIARYDIDPDKTAPALA